MSPDVLRRKNQKKAKRKRYNRCSVCGAHALCHMQSQGQLVPVLGSDGKPVLDATPAGNLVVRREYKIPPDVPVKRCSNGHEVAMPWTGKK